MTDEQERRLFNHIGLLSASVCALVEAAIAGGLVTNDELTRMTEKHERTIRVKGNIFNIVRKDDEEQPPCAR